MTGTLYVVATPIGNLADLSRRAATVLGEVELVVAEDTRRTRTLLASLQLESKPLRRLDANAAAHEVDALAALLEGGASIAMVTDAGTPSVSDPGAALVTRARARGAKIVPIPGASAVTTALSASGYAFGAFHFAGFLPRSGIERTRALAALAASRDPVVLFESPQRLSATLVELARAMPSRRATLARELTKLHEEILEAELPELARALGDREVLGEITIVLAPWQPAEQAASDADVDRSIDEALAAGLRPRDVAERVSLETGRSKRAIYQRVVERRSRGSSD